MYLYHSTTNIFNIALINQKPIYILIRIEQIYIVAVQPKGR